VREERKRREKRRGEWKRKKIIGKKKEKEIEKINKGRVLRVFHTLMYVTQL
jgi:hypothetical protein